MISSRYWSAEGSWSIVARVNRQASRTSSGTSGLTAAAYVTRFVKSQLYAIEPLDPPTFVVAAVVMLLTAAVSAYIPTRRAALADPMQSLRYE